MVSRGSVGTISKTSHSHRPVPFAPTDRTPREEEQLVRLGAVAYAYQGTPAHPRTDTSTDTGRDTGTETNIVTSTGTDTGTNTSMDTGTLHRHTHIHMKIDRQARRQTHPRMHARTRQHTHPCHASTNDDADDYSAPSPRPTPCSVVFTTPLRGASGQTKHRDT